ncbi:hypothetical protein VT84_01320 [Gemmata sp. SH-PL17]|nr:hypothetical protein VT84_01320 [Gemmata sp. SH-PL17]
MNVVISMYSGRTTYVAFIDRSTMSRKFPRVSPWSCVDTSFALASLMFGCCSALKYSSMITNDTSYRLDRSDSNSNSGTSLRFLSPRSTGRVGSSILSRICFSPVPPLAPRFEFSYTFFRYPVSSCHTFAGGKWTGGSSGYGM